MPARRASFSPFGLGHTKPHHFREMARVAWQNRDQLPYAWRVLRDGVCDGCALGTSGLRDYTLDSVHLCMVRLELLRLNTMPALDPAVLADVGALRGHGSAELRALGRLPVPLLRRRGDRGFRPLDWREAIALLAERLGALDPLRVAFYLTSRGIPNETYYAVQKAARAFGTPHVDNAARLCHAASTVAMRRTLGHGAATCSYRDWLDADLIVLFGSNTPNNQPVTTKYLAEAKRRGAQIAVVNPYREPGLERYWVPSMVGSALFGTRLADHWFDVDTGGDLAFLSGVQKALLAVPDGVARGFVAAHTSGFAELERALRGVEWGALEQESGTTRTAMEAFARLLVERPKAVLVWSMGLTQHHHGVDTVQALLNLGLARALFGPGRGLVPIRGHSGVQGGAEVGCVPIGDAATLDHYQRVWGFAPPRAPGLTAARQIDAAAAGELDALWLIGGNFLETLADEDHCRAALERPLLRVHQDIVATSMMLVEPADTVVLLPATTRYEIQGGVTETSTERRILFSPEIPGHRIAGARPEWEVVCEVVAAARPELAERLRFAGTAALRAEIAAAVPLYRGIETLQAKGDQVQWGGERLYDDGRFATADGRAAFAVVLPAAAPPRAAHAFLLSTRRGKQFNSMVQAGRDPLSGARRGDVLIAESDAVRLGLVEEETVVLRSARGGALRTRVKLAPIKPGNLEVHWPEGQVLLDGRNLDPQSLEPDYNASVTIERDPAPTD